MSIRSFLKNKAREKDGLVKSHSLITIEINWAISHLLELLCLFSCPFVTDNIK